MAWAETSDDPNLPYIHQLRTGWSARGRPPQI